MHSLSFPEETDDSGELSTEARFAKLAFLHELEDCTWVLLWQVVHRCALIS